MAQILGYLSWEGTHKGYGCWLRPLGMSFRQHFFAPAVLLLIVFSLMSPRSVRGEEIRLKNGDVLHGTVVEYNEVRLILDHPNLGRLVLSADAVDSVLQTETVPDDTGAPALVSSQKAPEESPSEAAVHGADDTSQRDWNLGVVFGGSFTNDDEGEKLSFNTRVLLDRKLPISETNLSIAYIYELDNDELDENNLTGILHRYWLKPDSRWLYLSNLRYDFDEFQSWRERIQGHGGVGYVLIGKETLQLWPYVGAGFRRDIDSQDQASPVEGVTGARLTWRTKNKQKMEYMLNYFKMLSNDDFRFVNILDWKIPFHRLSRLSFNTHLDYEYSNNPDPGFPHDNIKLTWGLQWDL